MVTINLLAALLGWTEFWSRDHAQMQNNGWADIRRRNSTNAMRGVDKVMGNLLPPQERHLQHGRVNVSWISIHPYTTNRKDLGSQEWRDALLLSYRVDPSDLSSCFNCCGKKLSIYLAIYCQKGVLFTTRNNKIMMGSPTCS